MRGIQSADGAVYTETVVHSPPEQFAAEAPYQIAIVDLDSGNRLTARILPAGLSGPVQIGDRVTFVEERQGVAYYAKIFSSEETSEAAPPGAVTQL